MTPKYKISAVSYLNTKPLLYGIYFTDLIEEADIALGTPVQVANDLLANKADIALLPVAVIPKIPNAHIIADYCIGCNGPVKTVCLYSMTPIGAIRRVWLDYESRTSVELIKILFERYWKMNVTFEEAPFGYETKMAGDTAGVVIGDKTIGLEDKYPYIYDLGAIWKQLTGLPFVFAAWVACKPIDPEFLELFNEAQSIGLDRIEQISVLYDSPSPNFDLYEYYTKYISYNLDEKKKQGLNLFLDMMADSNQ